MSVVTNYLKLDSSNDANLFSNSYENYKPEIKGYTSSKVLREEFGLLQSLLAAYIPSLGPGPSEALLL